MSPVGSCIWTFSPWLTLWGDYGPCRWWSLATGNASLEADFEALPTSCPLLLCVDKVWPASFLLLLLSDAFPDTVDLNPLEHKLKGTLGHGIFSTAIGKKRRQCDSVPDSLWEGREERGSRVGLPIGRDGVQQVYIFWLFVWRTDKIRLIGNFSVFHFVGENEPGVVCG